jgi:hypothetical protein
MIVSARMAGAPSASAARIASTHQAICGSASAAPKLLATSSAETVMPFSRRCRR